MFVDVSYLIDSDSRNFTTKKVISIFILWTFPLYVVTFQQHMHMEYITGPSAGFWKGGAGEGLVEGFPLPVIKNFFEKMEHFRGIWLILTSVLRSFDINS